ncbi:hypothetical protein ID866_7299 [Astraeus odoratus]|nr:hypothetical protein ID866_7299 [Astraeus odoratus]
MSEYWVSHKRYHCKYCNVYIADDKPSRSQHENGLRHKGNVERFVRGLYKAGEKRVREREEEKGIMAAVGRVGVHSFLHVFAVDYAWGARLPDFLQAAEAAYALDVASGRGPASSSSSTASSSRLAPPPPIRKPNALKPTNPYANYTTAGQLGYTDPDAEEAERRKGMGMPGEWTYVSPPPTTATVEPRPHEAGDVKTKDRPAEEESMAPADQIESKKRLALAPGPDEDDMRAFKLRKKTVGAGLGEIYDPGLIPIKLKSKKETEEQEPGEASTTDAPQALAVPRWSKIQWRKVGDDQSSTTEAAVASTPANIIAPSQLTPITSDPEFVSPAEDAGKDAQREPAPSLASVKEEDLPPPADSVTPPAGLFRKRKVPVRRGT